MKRTATRILAALLIGVVLAYLARNSIVRQAIEFGVKRQTGCQCAVAETDVEPFRGLFELRGLKLMNPPDFPQRPLIDLPLLRVEYEPLSMLRRKPHVRSLAIDVKEVYVVTNERGERNVTRLADTAGGGAPKKQERRTPYSVDLLRVHVGTVLIEDYSSGKHTQRRLALNTHATYRNVSESTDLSRLVLGTVFNQLGPAIGDVARGLGDALRGGGSTAGKAGKGLLHLFKKP